MIFGTKVAQRGFGTALIAVGMATALGGCGGSDNESTRCSADVCIKNENNFKATASLDVKRVATKAKANLTVSWDQLTTNLMKRTIDPAEAIESVTFMQIPDLSQDQVAGQLAKGTFDSNVVTVYRTLRVEKQAGSNKAVAMTATLDKFKMGSAYLDPAADYKLDANLTYMLLFATGTAAGKGTQSMVFLEPSDSESSQAVSAPQGGDILTFNADLSTPAHVSIPKSGPFLVDWSSLTKDGRDNDLVYEDVDGLMVAFYTKSVTELAADALNYDIHATTLYKVPIEDGAKKMDLTSAKTESGDAFKGFDRTDGIWAIGLLCSTCAIPTPLAVVLVDPT